MQTLAPVLAGLLLACSLLIPTSSALGADDGLGPSFETTIEIAGKPVPLPAGTWQVTGLGHTERHSETGEAFGTVQTVILVQRVGHGIPAMVAIRTNTIDVDSGWDVAAACARPGLSHAVLHGAMGTAHCSFVSHVRSVVGLSSAQAWSDTVLLARRHGLVLPATWLVAGIVAADSRAFLDVRYYFNPAEAGFTPAPADTWQASVWHPDRVGTDTPRAAFVAQLVAWVTGVRSAVVAGLGGRSVLSRPPAMPWDALTGAVPSLIDNRLMRLRALRDQGVLSDDAFRSQSDLLEARALAEIDPDATDPSWLRALQKTISWRVLASADTMLLSWLLTGDLSTAGSIAVLEAVTKVVAYFGHEMVWSAIGDGGHDLVNAIPLEPIGDMGEGDAETAPTWSRFLVGWLPEDWIRTPASDPAPTLQIVLPHPDSGSAAPPSVMPVSAPSDAGNPPEEAPTATGWPWRWLSGE